MKDEDLRDFFAAFAMLGLVTRNGLIDEVGDVSYEIADNMLKSRSRKEGGIVAIKPIKK